VASDCILLNKLAVFCRATRDAVSGLRHPRERQRHQLEPQILNAGAPDGVEVDRDVVQAPRALAHDRIAAAVELLGRITALVDKLDMRGERALRNRSGR
jgi:hypothetical protein